MVRDAVCSERVSPEYSYKYGKVVGKSAISPPFFLIEGLCRRRSKPNSIFSRIRLYGKNSYAHGNGLRQDV